MKKTKPKKNSKKNVPLRAMLKGDRLVIEIGIDTLAYALNHNDYSEGEVKISDPKLFARDFLTELNSEEEDGTTPVHKMLDGVFEIAINNGARGVVEVSDDDEENEEDE